MFISFYFDGCEVFLYIIRLLELLVIILVIISYAY